MYVYKQLGRSLPHNSGMQKNTAGNARMLVPTK